MSLIVNEKRLSATVKRLFKNSVGEIIGELLQNAQRAGASEIHFTLDREAQAIIVRDDGSGVAPDAESWSRVLRMADSFYQNETVEENQKLMGVGLVSLFALDQVKSVSVSSCGRCATIETGLLWESEDYWANWTDLLGDAPETVEGFELTIKYDEPKDTFSYNRLAHKFEYALTKAGDNHFFAAPRGYQDFLKIFLDGKEVDATLPAECVPEANDLIYDGFYEDNRLRIGQSASSFRAYAYVVWYGQIIRLDSPIPFLLEVSTGNPITPLAPTRSGLIKDRKLEVLRRFVEDAVFSAFADAETARRVKPAFVERLYQNYSYRAKTELPVCVVREVVSPPDRMIETSDDFSAQDADKVLSYAEIESRKIEVFESGVNFFAAARKNLPSYYLASEETTATASEWTETNAGAESFAAVLGGTIRFLVAGNRAKLPLKKLYWKPGAMIESVFAHAGEFAACAVDQTPADSDFRPVLAQVFVFEYGGSFDIEEVEGLCVELPMENDLLNEVLQWLGTYGKACFSPNDDYDYETQEADFDNSVSRLVLDLQGDTLSTNWSFNELKMLVGKLAAEIGENRNHVDLQITGIEFSGSDGGETKMLVKLGDEREIRLRVASHIFLN